LGWWSGFVGGLNNSARAKTIAFNSGMAYLLLLPLFRAKRQAAFCVVLQGWRKAACPYV